MTNKEVAIAFSNGSFEAIFHKLAEDVIWNIFGQKKLEGKAAVMAYCREVAAYFDTVETDFRAYSIMEDLNKVAINGFAAFKRDGETIAEVNSCDVYEFDDSGLVCTIRSYCITEK